MNRWNCNIWCDFDAIRHAAIHYMSTLWICLERVICDEEFVARNELGWFDRCSWQIFQRHLLSWWSWWYGMIKKFSMVQDKTLDTGFCLLRSLWEEIVPFYFQFLGRCLCLRTAWYSQGKGNKYFQSSHSGRVPTKQITFFYVLINHPPICFFIAM